MREPLSLVRPIESREFRGGERRIDGDSPERECPPVCVRSTVRYAKDAALENKTANLRTTGRPLVYESARRGEVKFHSVGFRRLRQVYPYGASVWTAHGRRSTGWSKRAGIAHPTCTRSSYRNSNRSHSSTGTDRVEAAAGSDSSSIRWVSEGEWLDTRDRAVLPTLYHR